MKNAQPAIADMAGARGIRLGKFDALRLGAAKVGVRNEEFSASLAILPRRLGEAREEAIKLGGSLDGVTLRGGRGAGLVACRCSNTAACPRATTMQRKADSDLARASGDSLYVIPADFVAGPRV